MRAKAFTFTYSSADNQVCYLAKKVIYSLALVAVKSHLFPQFVHLNRERGKVTAVTSSAHYRKRRDCGGHSRVGGHGMALGAWRG